jgi:hypothetical protein
MDPNWNDVKRILRQHEEISQANNNALQHILAKTGGNGASYNKCDESVNYPNPNN